MSIKDNLIEIRRDLPAGVKLVVVSKTHSPEKIMEAYNAGERIFGENRIQELKEKKDLLPVDIEWHFIGTLQTNKVKYIASFISMIHSGDSARLLQLIEKEAQKHSRSIDILLEIHIAQEKSKHGWEITELMDYLRSGEYKHLNNINFRGVMGMATYTNNEVQIKEEFSKLKKIFDNIKENFFTDTEDFNLISMGMSEDYRLAIECGSNMVRIGSNIFGIR